MVIKKNTSTTLLLTVSVYEWTVFQMVVCRFSMWNSVFIPTEGRLEMLDVALVQGTQVGLIRNCLWYNIEKRELHASGVKLCL